MNQNAFPFRTGQLLRVALILWVAYFGVLALIDWWFTDRDAAVLVYCAIQIMNSLFILGLSLLPGQRFWKGKALLPVALTLMAVKHGIS